MSTIRDWVGLSMSSGLGPTGFWHLVGAAGSPTAVLDLPVKDIKDISGLRRGQLSGLSESDKLRAAGESEIKQLSRIGARPVVFDDPCYPRLLKACSSPPPVLYVKGNDACLNGTTIAIVGSRAATSYGRRTARNMGRDMATSGVVVVSGLATGIDSEAHTGCLEGCGSTVGVLGCGLDVVYPRTNKNLYAQVVEHGVLVTEYCLGTRPEGFRFPARNRIIAGMCQGVIVVEAAKKSGSLITVQHALEEGRDVFAVPGQVDSVKSGGTHWLLQQGAVLIVSADDVLEYVGIKTLGKSAQDRQPGRNVELDPETRALFAIIDHYPKKRDELIQLSGLSAAKISQHLLLLELEGLIELLPGDQVCRIGT